MAKLEREIYNQDFRGLLVKIDHGIVEGSVSASLEDSSDFEENGARCSARVRSQEYYVQMMQAWFFATALTKQWEAALPYLQQHRLEDWVHRKAIQKARESYRIEAEKKEYLKTLK